MRKWIVLLVLLFTQPLISSEKKVLILIIASDTHPAYTELQQVWRSYMHLAPANIEAYFIKADPNLVAGNEVVGDTIFSKVEETYKPGILKKTVLSMECMLQKNSQFDYVLRTNLSSFYIFPRLLEFIDKLPEKNCYAAHPLLPSRDLPYEFWGLSFGWGTGFILSRDVVEEMVKNKEELFWRSSEIPDDVLVGLFCYRRDIPLIGSVCHAYPTYDAWCKGKDHIPQDAFHFRAKGHDMYRRPEDVFRDELMTLQELVKTFYPNN